MTEICKWKAFAHSTNVKESVIEITNRILEGVIDGETLLIGTHSHSRNDGIRAAENEGFRPAGFKLRIFNWVYERTYNDQQVIPNTMFGKTRFNKDGLYIPFKDSIDIKTDEGTVVASYNIDAGELYLLYDAVHGADEDSLVIYEKVLERFADEYRLLQGISPEQIAERRAELEIERLRMRKEREKQQLTTFITQRVTQEKSRVVEEVAMLQRDITSYKEAVINKSRQLVLAEAKMVALSGSESELVQKMQAEIDGIYTINHVVMVGIEGTRLVIETDNIYCDVEEPDSGESHTYLFGRYKITCDLNNSSVKFMNLDEHNKRKSVWGEKCQHPHVSGDGKPCLGNAATSVLDLVSQNEFRLLAGYLVSYLESVNLQDSAGKHYHYWDEVNPDTKDIIQKGGPKKAECRVCGDPVEQDERVTCVYCDGVVHRDCTILIKSGDLVCTDCADEHYIHCSKCEEYVHNDYSVTIDGDNYCEECAIAVDKAKEKSPAAHEGKCSCGSGKDVDRFCIVCGYEGCVDCVTAENKCKNC